MKTKFNGILTLLLALVVQLSFAQEKTVRGNVSDESGPLPGVSVIIKGTTKGVETDFDGNYTIQAKQGDVLVYSYVGLTTVEKKVGTSKTINVVMTGSNVLDEVIVVAYGTAKKSSFTGSAVQVDSKDLEKRQVSNVVQALTGKVPGMNISSGNSQPGTTPTVNIRGIGSFSAGTSPLYVVDGVPFTGDISSINSQDIESTTVLKDAASAALYGARGANGVILIQTKNGNKGEGKMTVSLDIRSGLNSRAIPDYDFMTDPGQYASKYFEGMYNYEMTKAGATPESAYAEANANYNNAVVYVPFEVPSGQNLFTQNGRRFSLNPNATLGKMITGADGSQYWLTPDDWSKEVFKDNHRQEYNLSIQGKGNNANYYFSTGFLDDKGYVVSSGFKRYSTRLRTDFEPADWVKFGGNISYTHYIANRLDDTTEGGQSGNIFAVTNYIAPIYPVYVRGGDKQVLTDKWGHKLYDYGTKQYPGLNRPFLAISNPLSNFELDNKEFKADVISFRGYVDIKPIEDLKITLSAGYDVDNTYGLWKANVFYGQFAKYGGIVERWFSKTTGLNLQQLVNYTKKFDDHNFNLLVGHEYYKSEGNKLSGQRENMYHPENTEVSGAIVKPSTSSSMSEYITEGYLGRLQYDYSDKYFASFSFRRDASSRFHKDHRWGNFWSVGASWLINKEQFMNSLYWVDLLKLKASYGQQGNDAIGNFRYTDLYKLTNSNDKFAVAFNSKGNKNITWEKSANLNVGLEFELWNKVISGGVDVFSREVSDMLFWRPTPTSAGYSGYYDNVGTMKNSGIEFTLNANIIGTKDVKWSVSVNGSHVKNELIKLPEEWEAVEDGYRDGSRIYKVGGSLYDRAYAHYLGVNDEGKPTWQTYNPETNEYGSTDDYSVAIEKQNRKIYTNLAPKLQGGISTNFEFHGIDLGISCSYLLGGKTYDGVYQRLMHGGVNNSSGRNWHKDILNSWTPENTDTDVPMINYGGKWANSTSDRFLTSRNYLAINNITLGYNIPEDVTKKLKLNSFRIYVAADNLALFSARKGFDPRFNYSVGYKPIKTVSGGVKFSF